MGKRVADRRTARQHDEATPGGGNPRLVALVWTALVLCNLAVFAQVASFEFVNWDDYSLVLPKLERAKGLNVQSVLWAFTAKEQGWRTPVTYLSLFLDTQLCGLRPAGYHVSNLVIHIASTLLLFEALRRMSGQIAPAGLAAALFAIHPLHVEPVAWVTGRWELLCGLFWVLGMWAYAGYCQRPGLWRYLLVAGSYVLAIFSKPMALAFPCALLLLDYWPLQRLVPGKKGVAELARIPGQDVAELARIPGLRGRDHPSPSAGNLPISATATAQTLRNARCLLLEKVPLFIIGGLGLWVSFGAKSENVAERGVRIFSLAERLGNALETYAIYAGQVFWPTGLSFWYPHPALYGELTWPPVVTAALVVGLVTLLAVALVKRLPWLVVGWWWYLGVFVPAVGVFQVGTHARADRYTYLPLIGLFTIVSWSLASLVRRRPRLKRPVVGLSLAALACLMVAAGRQAAYWRDSKTLLSHGVRVDSRNFKAWVNLGVVHIRQRNYRGAERIFRQGVAALPNEPKLRYYLGRCLSVYQGRFAEGMAEMERALELDPAYREARVTLADVLAAQGNQQGALEQYHEVIRRSPKDPDGYLFLGKYWLSKGEYDKAAAQFRRACELRPDHPEAPKLLEQALSAAREPRPTQPVTVEAIQ